MKSILHSHYAPWGDCQQLLIVFTPEEKEHIKVEAKKAFFTSVTYAEAALPFKCPNSSCCSQALETFYQCLMTEILGTAQNPTNLSKTTEALQGPEEFFLSDYNIDSFF